jgi:hypothetical protein
VAEPVDGPVAGAGAAAPSEPPFEPASDEPVSDEPALDDPDVLRPDPPDRPSLVAQPEPLNTIVGVESSLRIEPPHTGHVEGPWPWTPWRTSTV